MPYTNLTNALLFLQCVLGQLLPLQLHGQPHNVLPADGDQLLGLQGKRASTVSHNQ